MDNNKSGAYWLMLWCIGLVLGVALYCLIAWVGVLPVLEAVSGREVPFWPTVVVTSLLVNLQSIVAVKQNK